MKTGKIFYFTMLLIIPFWLSSCSSNNSGGMSSENQPAKYFATADEAAQQAKSDFLEVLRMDKGLNLGVDAASLERSAPQPAISTPEIDFGKLLEADPSKATFEQLGIPTDNIIIPYTLEGRVITAVSIGKDDKGWRVAGLGDEQTSTELSAVHQAIGQGDQFRITRYEVPNIQAIIYEVRADTSFKYYTNFKGMFKLEEPANKAELLKVLQAEAMDFQRQFGDQLKKGKLLK